MAKIVQTDNFNGDYPDEKFVENLGPLGEQAAKEICSVINLHCSGPHRPRWWKVVPDDYKLQPGFEP
jgi:hypothetical protein